MSTAWIATYRNFDDDALAALASVGLLRRAVKDVEAGKVALREGPDATHALLEVDGQQVRIGKEGPAHAKCDCPAPGVCKHILAVTLWLRDAPIGDAAPGAAPSAADALAEAMALDAGAVFKLAGVAATRKAAALLQEAGPVVARESAGVLTIELPEMDLVCRFIAGAGFQGMVSEAPAAARASMHLLALVALWRDRQRGVSWPAAVSEAAEVTVARLSASEQDVLLRVRRLLREMSDTGWSHVSDIMPSQLRAFAMSARVDAFPRLAALLRTLAGTAERLVRRDVAVDERDAIRLAARIDALCEAARDAEGDALHNLRGAVRRSFEGDATLELLPLGAHWWETPGGARGLTVTLWDPQGEQLMQTVLARRDGNDRGFTRDGAWTASQLWQGAGSARSLLESTVRLSSARLSADGRISQSGETRATVLPPWSVTDPRWLNAGFGDWGELAAALRASAGLAGESLDVVLLKPAHAEIPWLDELRQQLCWTLRDQHGMPLVLRLSCASQHLTRIDNIEGWVASGVALQAVLARIDHRTDGAFIEPLSIVIEHKGRLQAIALDYSTPPAGKAPTLLGRIARMLKPKEDLFVPAPAPTPAAAHLRRIESVLEIMEHKAMTGRLRQASEERDALRFSAQYFRAIGLDTLALTLEAYLAKPGAEAALRLLYLGQTCVALDTSFINR